VVAVLSAVEDAGRRADLAATGRRAETAQTAVSLLEDWKGESNLHTGSGVSRCSVVIRGRSRRDEPEALDGTGLSEDCGPEGTLKPDAARPTHSI